MNDSYIEVLWFRAILGVLIVWGSVTVIWASFIDVREQMIDALSMEVEEPTIPVKKGPRIESGPLVEVDLSSATRHRDGAVTYKGVPVDFSAHRGKWIYLVFGQIGSSAPVRLAAHEQEIAEYLTRIKAHTGELENFEIWFVRMNVDDMRGLNAGLLSEGPFYRQCEKYERTCFDRFIYAATLPGKDLRYVSPQREWFTRQIARTVGERDQHPTFPRAILVDQAGKMVIRGSAYLAPANREASHIVETVTSGKKTVDLSSAPDVPTVLGITRRED